MRNVNAFLILCVLAATVTPAAAQLLEPEEEKTAPSVYDRHEIPGNYTLGFYADERGTTNELTIPKDATEFDVWLGVTGDSTRVYSGLAMGIDLPPGVEVGGPIVWTPRAGLREFGNLIEAGITAEFNKDCAQQKSPAPVMLGHLRLKIQPGLNECTVAPAPHTRFGLSVELCNDERAWPKPYADAIPLKVNRKLTFWDKVKSWF